MLQFGDAVRRPHVRFAAHPVGVIATGIERIAVQRCIAECGAVPLHRFGCDFIQADAFNCAGGTLKIFFDEALIEPDGFENLRAAIGLISRDAHLGHHFQQAFADRLDVVLAGLFVADARRNIRAHVGQRLKGKIRMNRLGTIACEHRKVVHLTRGPGLDNQAGAGA